MPIISGIGSLFGGIVAGNADSNAGTYIQKAGSGASTAIGTAGNQAAAGTTAATNTAVSAVNAATTAGQAGVTNAANTANASAGNVLSAQVGLDSPYLSEGATGTANLQKLAANGGFQAPTAAQAAASPGEQFALQQGEQGVMQQMGASGGAATGGALKALTQYGQGVASTYYQNAFNNSLNAYNTNVNTNMGMANQGLQGTGMANTALGQYGATTNANTMGAGYYNAGLGMQGATTAGQMGMSGAETAGNQNMLGTEEAGNFAMQGANGMAEGIAGQGNALGQGIAGLANGFGGTMMMGMGGSYFGGGQGYSMNGGLFGGGSPIAPYNSGGSNPGYSTTPAGMPGNPYSGGQQQQSTLAPNNGWNTSTANPMGNVTAQSSPYYGYGGVG